MGRVQNFNFLTFSFYSEDAESRGIIRIASIDLIMATLPHFMHGIL